MGRRAHTGMRKMPGKKVAHYNDRHSYGCRKCKTFLGNAKDARQHRLICKGKKNG